IVLPYFFFGCTDTGNPIDEDDVGMNIEFDDWTKFQFDNKNSGVSNATPPRNKPEIVWENNEFGEISSPILADGKLYFGDINRYFYRLDASSGVIDWSIELNGRFPRSFPTIVDGVIYVGTENSTLYAISAESGESVWAVGLSNDIWGCPVILENRLYLTDQSGIVYCIDTQSGELIWSQDECLSNSTLAVKDNILYSLTQCNYSDPDIDFKLYAIDATSGDILWSKGFEGSGARETTISIKDNKVIFGTSGFIYCINLETREVEWRHEEDSRINFHSSAVIKDDKVFIGCWTSAAPLFNPFIICLDIQSGEEIWRNTFERGESIMSPPTIGNNNVLLSVVSRDVGLVALDAETGNELWRLNEGTNEYSLLRGSSRGEPILSKDYIFWGTGFRSIVALK
ncbi:MAG TPA: PQQ-binding-like beta-propeller repeat protein, partial [Bacteroidales bacterium]|nr:PQQ-binding-like beta-propeller repeat protein [Bacteroidales bacterium]